MKGKSSKVNHQWERLEMTLWKSSGCRRKTIFPVGRGSFAASWELAKVPQMRLSLKCVISYLHLKMLRVIYLSEKSSTSDNRYKLKQKKTKMAFTEGRSRRKNAQSCAAKFDSWLPQYDFCIEVAHIVRALKSCLLQGVISIILPAAHVISSRYPLPPLPMLIPTLLQSRIPTHSSKHTICYVLIDSLI